MNQNSTDLLATEPIELDEVFMISEDHISDIIDEPDPFVIVVEDPDF